MRRPSAWAAWRCCCWRGAGGRIFRPPSWWWGRLAHRVGAWAMPPPGGAGGGAFLLGWPPPSWPGALPWSSFSALVMPVLVVTLVSFLETASSAKVESQRSGAQWDENQDLIGQGLGKISSGLCGSFATSASFSRSAINLYAGAKSGWATLF